jgi:hypothetical protein
VSWQSSIPSYGFSTPKPIVSRRTIRKFRLHFDAVVYARELAERRHGRYEVVLGNPREDRAWKVVRA